MVRVELAGMREAEIAITLTDDDSPDTVYWVIAGLDPFFDPRPYGAPATAQGSVGLSARWSGATINYDALFYGRDLVPTAAVCPNGKTISNPEYKVKVTLESKDRGYLDAAVGRFLDRLPKEAIGRLRDDEATGVNSTTVAVTINPEISATKQNRWKMRIESLLRREHTAHAPPLIPRHSDLKSLSPV